MNPTTPAPKEEAAEEASGRPISRRPLKRSPVRPHGAPDLTSGPIAWTLLIFSLPVLGSNILQSINGSVNAIWVSHALGPVALTATSNANQVLYLMLGGIFGITLAANIMIGQAAGAQNDILTKRVIGSCASFFAIASVGMAVLGVVLAPSILAAMGTPADARADAIAYLRVIFLALPLISFFSFLMMAQRGIGDSRTPFLFSLLSVGLDVTLVPLFIHGVGPFPRLGVAGSATATLIANAITLTALMLHLQRRKSILALQRSDWRYFKPDLQIIRTVVTKGVPMAMQMTAVSLSAVTLMSFVNQYGSQTAAAYGAVLQLFTYIQMPAMALGAAVSTMAAQNLGAGRMDRVGRITTIGVVYALVATTLPVALIYLLEPWAIGAFLPPTTEAFRIASHINSIVLPGFILFGVAFIFSGVVRASGAVWPQLIVMVVSLWGVRVGMAWALTPYLAADAIWWSFPVGSVTMCVLAAAYYRFGHWRETRLLDDVKRAVDPADTGLTTPSPAEPSSLKAKVT